MEKVSALVLAAGIGSRLGSLTRSKPKALLEIDGIPLLEHLLRKLKTSSIDSVVINIHHYPDLIREFCRQHRNFGLNIQFSDESGLLLDTGAAVKQADELFGDADQILVHNADILSDTDLRDLIKKHRSGSADATLAVRRRDSSRSLLFDENRLLKGWLDHSNGDSIIQDRSRLDEYAQLAYSGIQVLERTFIRDMPIVNGPYSIVPIWLKMAGIKRIRAYLEDGGFWLDCGKPEVFREDIKFRHKGVDYDRSAQ